MIKLIVLDLDGTLITDQKELTQQTIDIIREAQEKRILVTIATGRAFELTKPYAEKLNIKIPLILNNGALIKHRNPESIITKHTLDDKTVDYFIDYANQHQLGYTFYAEDGFYTNDPNRTAFYTTWNESHPDAQIKLIQDPTKEDLFTRSLYKMLIVIPDEDMMSQTYTRFKDHPDFHVTQSLNEFFDVLPKGINKGTALKQLMESYHLKPENVLVFGDNTNDLEIFKVAMHTVAMPNASEDLKAIAKTIALDDNNNDGVAKTLKRFLDENKV